MCKTLLVLMILQCSILAHSQSIFSNDRVHMIEIEIPDSDYKETLSKNRGVSKVEGEHIYLQAKVTIDSVEIEGVGVRYKGASSYRKDLNKKSLKLDFNEFEKGQRFQGLRKLNLHNSMPDPSFLRDAISYSIFAQFGIKAPRLSFTKVFINQEYIGLYQVVEQIDKSFTKEKLFKNMGWYDFQYYGRDINKYRNKVDLKGKQDTLAWEAFFDLLQTFRNASSNDFKEEVAKLFDLDQFLRVLVVYTALNNYDSIIRRSRNWYLGYNSEQNIFTWIPWDNAFSLGANFLNQGNAQELEAEFCVTSSSEGKVILIDTSKHLGYRDRTWSLSDGTSSKQKQIEYNYRNKRRFEACLTITDIAGNEAQNCKKFKVPKIKEFCPLETMMYDEYNLPIYGEMSESKIVQKLFENQDLKEQYKALMCEFLEKIMTRANLEKMINEFRNLIINDVLNDPNLDYPLEHFIQEVSLEDSPFNLLNLLDNRISYLQDQINCN